MIDFAPLDNAGRIAGAGAAAGSRVVGKDGVLPRVERRRDRDNPGEQRDSDSFEPAEDEQAGYAPPSAAIPALTKTSSAAGTVQYDPSEAQVFPQDDDDDGEPHVDVVA